MVYSNRKVVYSGIRLNVDLNTDEEPKLSEFLIQCENIVQNNRSQRVTSSGPMVSSVDPTLFSLFKDTHKPPTSDESS